MTAHHLRDRVRWVQWGLLAILAMTFVRVLDLVVVKHGPLTALARRQQQIEVTLPPERGAIIDRNGSTLAVTVESASVTIDPKRLELTPQQTVRLAEILDLSPAFVEQQARRSGRFSWLKRNVTPSQADAVAGLRLKGVSIEPSRKREYPHGTTAGQLLGFAGVDGHGLEGLESAHDRYLKGTAERVLVERDAKGRYLQTSSHWDPAARKGADLHLTLDVNLQRVLEEELQRAVDEQLATGAYGVILDPRTGEVLALANVPLFDPNHVARFDASVRKNGAIAFRYEPGSTFKTILAAAALEAGVVTPEQRIHCEYGKYRVGSRTIHDHDPYGVLSFAEVMKYSSNIGAAKVAEDLGSDRYAKALEAFGFGRPTGVDLPHEASGVVQPRSAWRHINLVTASYGHGLSVTPLQLAAAYGAIANQGRLMRPHIVRRVIGPDGELLHASQPERIAQPISAATAELVTSMLREVVVSGTGTKAAVEDVAVAGKTGTTKKLEPNGRYSDRDYIASFVGYLPADAPRFVMLVAVDTPRRAIYGGAVAAPVFGRVGEYIADHFGLRTQPVAAPAPAPALPPPADGVHLISWAPPGSFGMPSYIGLPLREALQQATRAGWEVTTSGSGFVVAQDPPAGAETANGRQLRLELGLAME